MKYFPKQSDFDLLYQPSITLVLKAEILNSNGTVISLLNSIVEGGNFNIDPSSDVRRTTSITVIPTDEQSISIAEDSLFWLDKDIHIYLGIENLRTGEPVWYSQGYFVFTNANSSYDATTNQLTLNCSDWAVKLDGTKNGAMGQLNITIPAYSIEATRIWEVECETYTGSTEWDDVWNWAAGFYQPEWTTFTEEHISSLKDLYYDFLYNYDESLIEEKLALIREIYISEDSSGYINSSEQKYEDTIYVTVMKHNILRDVLYSVLSQLAGISKDKMILDDIGEYKGMSQYNPDYINYRKKNPLWNTVPYDLEFQCGDSKLSIATTIRDLYPNWELFFNTDNVVVCQMIPSCDSDPVIISNDILQDFLISEDTTIDLTEVKNVIEIWGQVFETDYYTEESTFIEGAESTPTCYSLTVGAYDEYCNGDVVSFLCTATSYGERNIKINDLETISLFDENTDKLYTDELTEGTCYTLKIKKRYIDKQYISRAYLQGTYQVHGLSVLSNGKSTEQVALASGNIVTKYSKEYFQEKYNCKNVNIQVIPDSPFVVEKLGEILLPLSGSDYENITSDSLCIARCDYELYTHARLTDSITITTYLMPFLQENIKVSYQRSDSEFENQYITKNISHDFDNNSTTTTLMRFYSLYENEN